MLHLSPHTNYYWYHGAADMRKSFDALSGLVQNHMQLNPLSGAVFIFMNKKKNQVKLLCWDGDGMSIYYKRLEKGVYELPVIEQGQSSLLIDYEKLQFILQGVMLSSIRKKKRFKPLIPA
jgi:hypothetical protein